MTCKKTIIILSLSLFSCASRAEISENRLFSGLTDSAKYFLLPPSGIENSMDMFQRISAFYGGRDYILNAWVKADETGLDMTLLNEMGTNMGNLSYRNGAVTFSSAVFPQSIKPEYIVADFQLCFYNALLLRPALEDCGLTLETTGNGRRILSGEKVIIEIEKNSKSVRFVNNLRGYSYILEGEFH